MIRDTSQQHKTHVTECRELCYPWHPCYGQQVSVHSSLVRSGTAVFRCSLNRHDGRWTCEVPQWMFDRAVCCAMRVVDVPATNCQALHQLKELLRAALMPDDGAVIQDQHCSLALEGDADEKIAPSSTCRSAGTVSSTSANAHLADVGSRDQNKSDGTAGTNAARASRRPSRRQRREGQTLPRAI